MDKTLGELRNSKDPYDRVMAKGIKITMKAYGRDIDEKEENEDQ